MQTTISRSMFHKMQLRSQPVQDAKAAALGPRHQTNVLPEALTEPLLSTVQQQADTAAANGWFWTYQLDGIKVCNDSWPAGQLGRAAGRSLFVLLPWPLTSQHCHERKRPAVSIALC